VTTPTWEDLAAGLPTHQDEVMAAHEGRPTAEVQNASHGAGTPEPDLGLDDHLKYAGGAC
jgi:hypothetical protein